MGDHHPEDPHPLPSPPFHSISGIANFRDLGGHSSTVTKDGRPITTGFVFRCADPSKAREEGLRRMRWDLGIKTIFDLRSLPEIHREGSASQNHHTAKPSSEQTSSSTTTTTTSNGSLDPNEALTALFSQHGITRHWTPVFAASDYGPEQIALRYKAYTRSGSEGFVAAYRDILNHAGEAFGTILRYLSAETQEDEGQEGKEGGLPASCVFHCTAGKDRTGLLAALLLSLAGVDDETIAEEYALTDQGLAPLRELFVTRLLANPVLEGDEEGVRNMVSSKRENMLAALGMVRGEFGGWEVYVRERCGLGEGEVGRLRSRLRGER